MEPERRCPACGGHVRPWRTVRSAEPSLPGNYTLLRCEGCGSAITLEPAPPGSHDGGAYGGGAPRLSRLVRPLLRSFDRRRLKLLAPLAESPGRLLDVGAGRGRFVAAARAAGWTALALEPSERGALAASALGVPTLRARIDAADLPTAEFGAVTAWHVLEHLDDPAGALERIAQWLRPGGALLVGVPNLESLQARVCPARWYHLDVPRHRVHFTPAGLDTLLRAKGFEPVAATHLLQEHNPFGMWQTLASRFTAQPSYLYNLLKRNATPRSRDLWISIVLLPLAPVAALAELLAGMSGRGGTIAVLSRRAE